MNPFECISTGDLTRFIHSIFLPTETTSCHMNPFEFISTGNLTRFIIQSIVLPTKIVHLLFQKLHQDILNQFAFDLILEFYA